ncbi:MAG: hypothetical protein H7331_01205 [Bacteroidia bacterium]|nr:hypothetical protein [Bacteroidia bacterium]
MKITSNKHTSGTLAVAQNGYLTLAVAGVNNIPKIHQHAPINLHLKN